MVGDTEVATLLERLGRAIWGGEHDVCCNPASPAFVLVVRCARCGELIRSRIDKAADLEAEYESGNGHYHEEEEPRPTGYTLHKELVGAGCQNLIHVTMHLDCHRLVASRQITGGEFVDVIDCA